MVGGIQSGSGGLDRGQLKAMVERLQRRAAEAAGEAAAPKPVEDFAQAMVKNMAEVDQAVKSSDKLPLEAVKGDLDFHEVAARVKEAELTFDFAMQVRNKLLDAYREVMRMSV